MNYYEEGWAERQPLKERRQRHKAEAQNHREMNDCAGKWGEIVFANYRFT